MARKKKCQKGGVIKKQDGGLLDFFGGGNPFGSLFPENTYDFGTSMSSYDDVYRDAYERFRERDPNASESQIRNAAEKYTKDYLNREKAAGKENMLHSVGNYFKSDYFKTGLQDVMGQWKTIQDNYQSEKMPIDMDPYTVNPDQGFDLSFQYGGMVDEVQDYIRDYQLGGNIKVSKTGYLSDSADYDEPAVKILSNKITMNGVDRDLILIPDSGEPMVAKANSGEYVFPDATHVVEVPLDQAIENFKQGGIHIKKANRGKFTAAANRAGMGVQEYASHVLANKDKYSSTLVKRANFARNASKWKHQFGGEVNPADMREGDLEFFLSRKPHQMMEKVPHFPFYQGDMIKLKDDRKIRATTGKEIDPNRDLKNGTYSADIIRQITASAKRYGVDPYTAVAVALAETNLGRTTQGNVFHVIHEEASDDPIFDQSMIDTGVYTLKQKMRRGKDLFGKDEARVLQTFNGLGEVFPSTEKGYHGFEMKAIYGVPLPEDGIDLADNPLYGINVIDLRDNVLKKNPEIKKIIDSVTDKDIKAYEGHFKALERNAQIMDTFKKPEQIKNFREFFPSADGMSSKEILEQKRVFKDGGVMQKYEGGGPHNAFPQSKKQSASLFPGTQMLIAQAVADISKNSTEVLTENGDPYEYQKINGTWRTRKIGNKRWITAKGLPLAAIKARYEPDSMTSSEVKTYNKHLQSEVDKSKPGMTRGVAANVTLPNVTLPDVTVTAQKPGAPPVGRLANLSMAEITGQEPVQYPQQQNSSTLPEVTVWGQTPGAPPVGQLANLSREQITGQDASILPEVTVWGQTPGAPPVGNLANAQNITKGPFTVTDQYGNASGQQGEFMTVYNRMMKLYPELATAGLMSGAAGTIKRLTPGWKTGVQKADDLIDRMNKGWRYQDESGKFARYPTKASGRWRDPVTGAFAKSPIKQMGGPIDRMSMLGTVKTPLEWMGYLNMQEGGGMPEFSPVQLEKGEEIIFEDNSIVKPKASKRHSQMNDYEYTDVLPSGTYIASRDKSQLIDRDHAKGLVVQSMGPLEYSENEVLPIRPEKNLGDMFRKKRETPASIARNIRSRIPTTDNKDMFGVTTNALNRETRAPYNEALMRLAEKKRTSQEDAMMKYGGYAGYQKGGTLPYPATQHLGPAVPLLISAIGSILGSGLKFGAANKASNDITKNRDRSLYEIGKYQNRASERNALGAALGAGSVMGQYASQDTNYSFLDMGPLRTRVQNALGDMSKNIGLQDRLTSEMQQAPLYTMSKHASFQNPQQGQRVLDSAYSGFLNADNQRHINYLGMQNDLKLKGVQLLNPIDETEIRDRQAGEMYQRSTRNLLNQGLFAGLGQQGQGYVSNEDRTDASVLAARMAARGQATNALNQIYPMYADALESGFQGAANLFQGINALNNKPVTTGGFDPYNNLSPGWGQIPPNMYKNDGGNYPGYTWKGDRWVYTG